jgi:hypothetical protein
MLLAATLAFAMGATASQDAPKLAYYATKVGDKRTYKNSLGEFTLVVTKVEKEDGKTIVSVGQVQDGGKVTRSFKMEVSDKGLFQLELAVVVIVADGLPPPDEKWEVRTPPLCLLKLPAKPGDKWEVLLAEGLPGTCTTSAPERVKVPAGEYTAIPVDMVVTPARGPKRNYRYWYVEGIGAVKWGNGTDDTVLKEFSPGK